MFLHTFGGVGWGERMEEQREGEKVIFRQRSGTEFLLLLIYIEETDTTVMRAI